MTNLVSIASKLPHALVLESGDARVVLNGAKQTAISPKGPTPGVTGGVDEALFDAWCAEHADSTIVTQKLIWKMT
jgi:hypothetical protein